jgi:hypothetical protein
MSDSTKVSDSSMELSERTADEPAPVPEQMSNSSPGAEEGEFVSRSSTYSGIHWPWPQDWDGFEEFVKKSREESSIRREPPPWW